MILFHKKVSKFISVNCPECQGHLDLDENIETALFQNRKKQSIEENVIRRENEVFSLDKNIAFVERQQNLRRKDRIEKRKATKRRRREVKKRLK